MEIEGPGANMAKQYLRSTENNYSRNNTKRYTLIYINIISSDWKLIRKV